VGGNVGIIDDGAFFGMGEIERRKLLTEWDWVEFKCPLEHTPPLKTLAHAGFQRVDTQINFRIGLTGISSSPSLDKLEVGFADQQPFKLDVVDLAHFEHERYQFLPAITAEKIDGRYALWSARLIAEQPHWCVRIKHHGDVQGWFLSRMIERRGLNLSLAMQHRDSRISGALIYQRALLAFAARGARQGWASFSVSNTAVMNIYANLGARFLAPVGNWIWWKE
jgi:hypothetical protein